MTGNPLWYQEALIYQLRVRSFYDSDGDGIGDLRGVTEKLDYLQNLGVTALWMLPFYPSPLRDDGYDISDYTSIHPDCGTLRDFRALLREAHRRGLRVITELVVNHTSDAHPWFQRARRAPPGSRWRDFYVWSDTPTRYADARIIFQDFEQSNWSWDPIANAYYWHRFYSHQPDLNYDNAQVRRAIFQALDFWLDMGVDGMRLDAVPYLIEREGTSCENLPETHDFLRELRSHVDERFPGRMLLAEANQWPEDAVAYFGEGDECHMAFHFPIMPRLFMSIQMEDRHPIIDILEQTPTIPETCQWALFLRNHDELTLEMVTDEERDYMWRAYARDRRARINLGIRRRLAPLLGNNRRKIELMNALLFSLPGTPVLYYGDEIGMGDNVYLGDRNGVRTPMHWSPDRNAGFSRVNPQKLFLPVIIDPEYHYEAVNVETQQNSPSSLLWWTKRVLSLRNQFPALGRGSFEPLTPSNRKILAYLRSDGKQRVLVIANLSRFSQHVTLDLSAFRDHVPLELFGHSAFPAIGDTPYPFTLGPHGFFWFSLEPPPSEAIASADRSMPAITAPQRWERLLEPRDAALLERALPEFLRDQRWFRGKGRRVASTTLAGSLHIEADAHRGRLALVRVEYREGEPECYVLALAHVPEAPEADCIARLRDRDGAESGVLAEVSREPWVAQALLDLLRRRRRPGAQGLEIRPHALPALRRAAPATPRALGAEQTNTSWIFGDQLVAKLLRRVDEGMSPDVELGLLLTRRGLAHVAPLAGHLDLHRAGEEPATLAVFQSYVPNEGDAWSFTLDEIDRYLEDLMIEPEQPPPLPTGRLVDRAGLQPPPVIDQRLGTYLDLARLLGQRTSELHAALASAPDDGAFAPEPFNPFGRRSLYQSLRNLTSRSLDALAEQVEHLDGEPAALARRVLERREEILARFAALRERRLSSRRIRIHGDLHLGQVLYTGRDFCIIDFEGEPARTLSERRAKRSPLVDVAGMLRSFHYAIDSVRPGSAGGSAQRPEDAAQIEPWARLWYAWVSATYVDGYLSGAIDAGVLPQDRDEISVLLETLMLEKAVYEVGYEINNRPAWIGTPLRGVLDVLESSGEPR